jgi:hypothetical protein
MKIKLDTALFLSAFLCLGAAFISYLVFNNIFFEYWFGFTNIGLSVFGIFVGSIEE